MYIYIYINMYVCLYICDCCLCLHAYIRTVGQVGCDREGYIRTVGQAGCDREGYIRTVGQAGCDREGEEFCGEWKFKENIGLREHHWVRLEVGLSRV